MCLLRPHCCSSVSVTHFLLAGVKFPNSFALWIGFVGKHVILTVQFRKRFRCGFENRSASERNAPFFGHVSNTVCLECGHTFCAHHDTGVSMSYPGTIQDLTFNLFSILADQRLSANALFRITVWITAMGRGPRAKSQTKSSAFRVSSFKFQVSSFKSQQHHR